MTKKFDANFLKYSYEALGVVAFVIGGLLTRSKAIEISENLRDIITSKD